MHILKIIQNHSSLLLLALLFAGCYEKEEGCLDIIATNFAYDADLACESCCSYPKLSVEFNHLVDTNFLKIGENVLLGEDQWIRFESIAFFINSMKLEDDDGNFHNIQESISLVDHLDGDIVKEIDDDFAWVKPPSFKFTLGTFTDTTNYVRIHFDVGIRSSYTLSDEDADHPLSNAQDSVFIDELTGFVNSRFVVLTDTLNTIPDTFEIRGAANFITLEKDFSYNFLGGADLKIFLDVDYLKWFEGVDFETQSNAEISKMVRLNTNKAFLVN